MEKSGGVSDANRAAWIEGDESDIVVGPFESVLVAKPQTLYPIPRNQIEPGDFGVARVWPDEAVTCVGKVRLKELS